MSLDLQSRFPKHNLQRTQPWCITHTDTWMNSITVRENTDSTRLFEGLGFQRRQKVLLRSTMDAWMYGWHPSIGGQPNELHVQVSWARFGPRVPICEP